MCVCVSDTDRQRQGGSFLSGRVCDRQTERELFVRTPPRVCVCVYGIDRELFVRRGTERERERAFCQDTSRPVCVEVSHDQAALTI